MNLNRSVILLTLLLACAGCGEQNSGENVSGLSQADAEALNDAAEKLDEQPAEAPLPAPAN